MQADKTKVVRLLKTARGQIDGVLKMIEDDRYCIDIANQIMASDAILKKATNEILSAHMLHCVMQAEGDDREVKMQELLKILDIFMKEQ
ncbi:MAG: metal-sensing transcriptional repressor [Erysipelotrichales bacterium]|nr:metal-sensing transcriptional repressor [Erysipelotrichales bacterium]